ncbi:MAG: hypothetical protein ACI8XO_000619 [Verrucomicrobiales bacterium]|jgi:hypothetical protein
MQTLRKISILIVLFLTSVAPLAFSQADSTWWSLQTIERPQLPQVDAKDWPRNPIDRFILAKLEKTGLQPAPEADSHTLRRRLHFNLIGLPPDPGATADIDALLASQHYGERWARHWLDVARFGESQGFEYDQLREHAWPYRDWVISAFNDDMPYDRFVQLQIAGDRIEPGNPEAITATSFLVCGSFDGLKPNGDKQRKIMRQDEMEDLVGTVSQSFLGLTVNCARCHDHKFDPITQKEYFQIASALAGVHRGDRKVAAGGDPSALKKRIDELSKQLNQQDAEIRAAILAQQPEDSAKQAEPPKPVSRWTFDSDLRDEIGAAHGEAKGGAKIVGGALVLDGKSAFVTTASRRSELRAKTLEAWVQLDNLDQRGGAAISVQNVDGGQFDAIVFAEKDTRQWMAGSDGYTRWQNFNAGQEKDASDRFVHVAITYSEDGTITSYRDGRPYGKPYKTGSSKYLSNNHQVLFGLRHGTAAGTGRMLAGKIDRAQLYDRALSAEEVAISANVRIVTEAQIIARLNPRQKVARDALAEQITSLNGDLQKIAEKKIYAVTPKKAPVTRLLERGSPFEPAEEVAAGGVASVASLLPAEFGLRPDAPDEQRRLKLAEWITHPDNPLFARVMMNRLWHYHFGQGLVKTPNDLGFSGGEASHPQLLDWLAAEFRSSGWSLKKMHRLICDSATYRQSSTANPKAQQIDAGNLLLWRHTPSRLEAEAIRDSILKVAGQLNPQMGGPGYRDFKMYNHKGSWVYDPIDPEGAEFNRRSIYRTWARGNVHPLLAPLDCPDPSTPTPTRSVTTTPLGALALMNTSFVLRMSDKFAERLQTEAGDGIHAQIKQAFRLAFSRDSKNEELELTREFIEKNGMPAFCRVLFNSNEFLYVN